jgi:hypothetical protein
MDHMLAVGMTIKFIDEDSTLLKLLLVSRTFNEMLRDQVLKQALMRSSQEKLSRKRTTLWLKILQIDTKIMDTEYMIYRQ